MSIKSKLKNTKKGFLNPIIIFGILAVVGLAIFAPKIADKLSVVGIADDYLIYDDFEKSYLDDNLWQYSPDQSQWGSWYVMNYFDRTLMQGAGVSDGYFFAQGAKQCNGGYKGVSGFSLAPIKEMPGYNFKTKMTVSRVKAECGGTSATTSTAKVYINDVLAYTCQQSSSVWGTRSCVIEGIASFENPEIYTIRLNGEDYATVDTTNPIGDKKIKIVSSITRKDDSSNRPASVRVDYFKYKIPYNCKIEDDEVLVFDSFSEGSTVNISNLAYEPVKFCLDYPIKARSFSEEGIKTDIRGEILQKIVRGQSSTVPPAEEWKVYYITKNVPNIELRCGVDEAYNTNTGLCESPNEKAIVGCNAQSDCYIPPGCTGVSCSCVDNKCEYVGSCIYQPQTKSTSLWDKIMTLGFMQWIAGLFN